MIGNISEFWNLTRELDLGAIRNDFERRSGIAVLGTDLPSARRVAEILDPEAAGDGLEVETLASWGGTDHQQRRDVLDACFVAIGGPLDAPSRRAVNDIIADGTALIVAQTGDPGVMLLGVPEDHIVSLDGLTDDQVRDKLMNALLNTATEAALPLGRRYSALRGPIANHLILDASRVNAQFAAISSLPAAIPFIGGAVGGAADMLVLTKNQIVLIFKLAGLYGRDLKLGRRLLAEIVPVVGSAFLWRSGARTLVGLLPPVASLVPKVGIAYTGTYVLGHMARYYYENGRKPPRALAEGFARDGMAFAKSVFAKAPRLPRGSS